MPRDHANGLNATGSHEARTAAAGGAQQQADRTAGPAGLFPAGPTTTADEASASSRGDGSPLPTSQRPLGVSTSPCSRVRTNECQRPAERRAPALVRVPC